MNNQFYNNQRYDDTTTHQKDWYGKIAHITDASKLMFGANLYDGTPYGYLTASQLVTEVIQPLRHDFPSFGGVMGWELSYDTDGSWGQAVAQARVAAHDEGADHALRRGGHWVGSDLLGAVRPISNLVHASRHGIELQLGLTPLISNPACPLQGHSRRRNQYARFVQLAVRLCSRWSSQAGRRAPLNRRGAFPLM